MYDFLLKISMKQHRLTKDGNTLKFNSVEPFFLSKGSTFAQTLIEISSFEDIPAWFTPKVMLVQSISGATFLHAIIGRCRVGGIHGSIPFSFLFLHSKSIVISCVPVRVHLHVFLTLNTSLLVVFGLFFSTQSVPLELKVENEIGTRIDSRISKLAHFPHSTLLIKNLIMIERHKFPTLRVNNLVWH